MPLPVTPLPPAPADVTVAISADGDAVTLTVDRNWSAFQGLTATVEGFAADAESLVGAVTAGPTSATIMVPTPTDGIHAVTVTYGAGVELLRMGVPAVGRAALILRRLNKPLATGGRTGQATADNNPDWKPWRSLRVRLRLALACAATADYTTAQSLIETLGAYAPPLPLPDEPES